MRTPVRICRQPDRLDIHPSVRCSEDTALPLRDLARPIHEHGRDSLADVV
jgi:hypothetical protein